MSNTNTTQPIRIQRKRTKGYKKASLVLGLQAGIKKFGIESPQIDDGQADFFPDDSKKMRVVK